MLCMKFIPTNLNEILTKQMRKFISSIYMLWIVFFLFLLYASKN
jgi:hypothetical protein